ncbi:porin [Burkholderia metallica]|uniref:porin n=1 Tax=Burkholderia metallica TaxID=488729 RepID=UPI00131DA895|nr:porin [Burkholderia metallica]
MLALTGSTVSIAQSNVTVYGVTDAFVGRITGNGTGVNANDKATTRLDSGGMTFSRLGFTGSENLGGGYSATFDLSTFIRLNSGASGRSDVEADGRLCDGGARRHADQYLARSFDRSSQGDQLRGRYSAHVLVARPASPGAPALHEVIVSSTFGGIQ